MARSTHGTVTITCDAWSPMEHVVARTVFTAGDNKFINEQAMKSSYDSNAPDGVALRFDFDAQKVATVAKMTLSWTLQKDKVDIEGNPIMLADTTIMQEPLVLTASLKERLAAVESLHGDDVTWIYEKIMEEKPKPKTEEEKKPTSSDVTEPSLTN